MDIHQIFSATAEPFLAIQRPAEGTWRLRRTRALAGRRADTAQARSPPEALLTPSHGWPGYTARGYHAADFTDAFSRYIRREVSDRRETGPEQRGKDENQ
ncbi:MAG: hypothetical protein H6527_03790 [Actinobacteria bacterium]|nr:hypothetical protein [Actinomycetota bacterium]